jgi:hypothetical protein
MQAAADAEVVEGRALWREVATGEAVDGERPERVS